MDDLQEFLKESNELQIDLLKIRSNLQLAIQNVQLANEKVQIAVEIMNDRKKEKGPVKDPSVLEG